MPRKPTAGNGGENHQTTGTMAGAPPLTNNQGMHVSDNQNQLKAGARGPNWTQSRAVSIRTTLRR